MYDFSEYDEEQQEYSAPKDDCGGTSPFQEGLFKGGEIFDTVPVVIAKAGRSDAESPSAQGEIYLNLQYRPLGIECVNISAFSVLGEFVPVSIILRFHLG